MYSTSAKRELRYSRYLLFSYTLQDGIPRILGIVWERPSSICEMTWADDEDDFYLSDFCFKQTMEMCTFMVDMYMYIPSEPTYKRNVLCAVSW